MILVFSFFSQFLVVVRDLILSRNEKNSICVDDECVGWLAFILRQSIPCEACWIFCLVMSGMTSWNVDVQSFIHSEKSYIFLS